MKEAVMARFEVLPWHFLEQMSKTAQNLIPGRGLNRTLTEYKSETV
jgi:hypothetical protein